MAARKSRRAAITSGLGLGGLIALPVASMGQEPAGGRPGEEKAGEPRAGLSQSIGIVDIEAILKDSRKIRAANEQMKADASGRQKDLQKIVEKGKELADDLGRQTPGTQEHDRIKGRLEQLSAQLEAEKRKAQQEFSAREARELASIYREIEKHVEAVARSRGLGLVLRLAAGPIDENNPQNVMAALSRFVVFADPKLDITAEVRDRLNRR